MPTGDAPTTSKWWTILLPTKVYLILEVFAVVSIGSISQWRQRIFGIRRPQWVNADIQLLCLSHWGWDKMAAILQNTFSNAFSWMKIIFWFKFHWDLFLRVKLTIIQHWFRLWLGTEQPTSHYLNQLWPSLVMHICISRPQWVVLWAFGVCLFCPKTYMYLRMKHKHENSNKFILYLTMTPRIVNTRTMNIIFTGFMYITLQVHNI